MKWYLGILLTGTIALSACDVTYPTQAEYDNCAKYNLNDSVDALRSCLDGQMTERLGYKASIH